MSLSEVLVPQNYWCWSNLPHELCHIAFFDKILLSTLNNLQGVEKDKSGAWKGMGRHYLCLWSNAQQFHKVYNFLKCIAHVKNCHTTHNCPKIEELDCSLTRAVQTCKYDNSKEFSKQTTTSCTCQNFSSIADCMKWHKEHEKLTATFTQTDFQCLQIVQISPQFKRRIASCKGECWMKIAPWVTQV